MAGPTRPQKIPDGAQLHTTLPPDLLQAAREHAAREGLALAQVLRSALRDYLRRHGE